MPKAFTPAMDCALDVRPAIELKPVASSQIKAIGYIPKLKTLDISFTRGPGNVYCYEGVSQEKADAFMNAESLGAHFGKHIAMLPSKKYAPDIAAETTGSPPSDQLRAPTPSTLVGAVG